MSQPPKQSAVGSWENSSEVLSSWRLFGSERAEPQRTIPFFCWDRAAFFGRTRGREYSNLKSLKEKCRLGRKKALCLLHLFISFFRVTSLHTAIPALPEKLPKWHFLIRAWNLKFFGPNDFIWGAIKVPFFDFIQKISLAPSSSVQVLIWEDKLDYLNNPSQDFKKSFCLWFLWIFNNAGRQN